MKFKIFTITGIIVLFAMCSYLLFNQKKIGFIDNNKIFIDFTMTKEIDKELKLFEANRQHTLDSLIDIIKKADAGILKVDEKEYSFLRKQYEYKSNQFAKEIATTKQAEIDKIWKRINEYVADYSKEKNYFIVFGANGQGVLMYAKEDIEISKEVTEYINEKYNGKK